MNSFPTASFQEAVGNLKLSEADAMKHFKACQLLHWATFRSHFPLRFQKCTYLGTEQEWQNMSTWTLPLISPSRQSKCVVASPVLEMPVPFCLCMSWKKKKKHILIKSPTIEYVKKGVGQASWKNLLLHKANLKFPPESSTDLETAQDEEFTRADSNKPNGNHNNIFRVAWGTWEPDPCRARQTQTFKFIRHFAKPVCCEMVFIKIPAKHKPTSMLRSLWWFKDLTHLLLDFLRENNYSSTGCPFPPVTVNAFQSYKYFSQHSHFPWTSVTGLYIDSVQHRHGGRNPVPHTKSTPCTSSPVRERTRSSLLSGLDSLRPWLTLSKSFLSAILLVTSSWARSSFSCSSLMLASCRRRFSRCGDTEGLSGTGLPHTQSLLGYTQRTPSISSMHRQLYLQEIPWDKATARV